MDFDFETVLYLHTGQRQDGQIFYLRFIYALLIGTFITGWKYILKLVTSQTFILSLVYSCGGVKNGKVLKNLLQELPPIN